MSMECIEFAENERAQEETIPPMSTYVLECNYDVFDPKAFDQFAGRDAFTGKSVQAGSWQVRSENLDYLMSYAEGLDLTWAADRLTRPEECYAVGRFEIRRQGMPLLSLDGHKWVAVGDDYLDPWTEEVTSNTQLLVVPEVALGEEPDPEAGISTAPYDARFHDASTFDGRALWEEYQKVLIPDTERDPLPPFGE